MKEQTRTCMAFVVILSICLICVYNAFYPTHQGPPKPIVIENMIDWDILPITACGDVTVADGTLVNGLYLPNADTMNLITFCCTTPYPKDWLYCPYCGQDLSTNRRIRKWESIPTWTVSQTCDTCKTVWTYSNIDKPRAQLCPTCPTPEEGEE